MLEDKPKYEAGLIETSKSSIKLKALREFITKYYFRETMNFWDKLRSYFKQEELFILDVNFKRDYPLRYPVDFVTNRDSWEKVLLDQNGIPIKYYRNKIQYNPTRIAGYALKLLKIYLDTRNIDFYDKFMVVSNWFINNIRVKNNYGRYEYDEYYEDLKEPWISGMAQGQAISVLTRAYLLSRKDIYLDVANLAMNSLIQPLEEGGVLFKKKLNDRVLIFFEEVPSKNPTHILNGNIYSMIAIYDYLTVCDLLGKEPQQHDLRLIFNLSVETLKLFLPLYDTSYWSRYDIKTIASYHYHWIHIVQLEALYKLLDIKEFLFWSKKFRSYTSSKYNCMKALSKKFLEKSMWGWRRWRREK